MPGFGASIEGVDFTSALDSNIKTKLREAWLTFGVLFFRGQAALSPDQQVEAAKTFGPVHPGNPNVDKTDNEFVEVLITDETRPPVTNLWHCDNSFDPVPPVGLMIQIQNCPLIGGNTVWASMRKAYACLSDEMKHYLEGLLAIHTWDGRGRTQPVYMSGAYDDRYYNRLRTHPPSEHQIVMEHPFTGEKSLFVNETFTTYIKGLHKYESSAILQFLFDWIRLPEFQLHHHWQKNDIAVWNNYAMQHYALGDYSSYRVNHRVTISAD